MKSVCFHLFFFCLFAISGFTAFIHNSAASFIATAAHEISSFQSAFMG